MQTPHLHDDLITRVIHKILPIIYIISDDILHMHDTCVKAPPTIQIFAYFINLCCLLHSLIIYVLGGEGQGGNEKVGEWYGGLESEPNIGTLICITSEENDDI